MTEILSLSKARKARERSQERKRAEENRVKFGRTRSERRETELTDELDRRRLDAHRRAEPSGSSDPEG
jgi:hypothetical protein